MLDSYKPSPVVRGQKTFVSDRDSTFGRLKPEVYNTVLKHTAEQDCQNGMCLPVDPSKSLHRPW